MPNKYLKVVAAKNADEQSEILVHGPIGTSLWDDSGISGKDFTDALDQFKNQEVTVGVNSQGGVVGEGLAIYNAIQRHGRVTVRIDGYALSIASVFPLAARKVVSPKSSLWMIHNARNYTEGDYRDSLKNADMLKKHDDRIVGIYAEKTGKSEAEIRAAMDAETWLSGEESLQWGLSDELVDSDTESAKNALDFSKAPSGVFKNAPSKVSAIFKNLPAATGVAGQHKKQKQPADSPGGQQQTSMKKETIVALLKTQGIEASVDETIEALEAKLTQAFAKKQPETKQLENKSDNADILAQLKEVKAQLEKERVNRVTRALDQLVVENRLTVEVSKEWLAKCLVDETILDSLKKLPQVLDGAEPLGHVVNDIAGTPLQEISKLPIAKKAEKLRNDWDSLWSDAQARHARSGKVFAANTYPAGLITDYLSSSFIVTLQNRLAAFSAFALTISLDPFKPKAQVQIGKGVSGSATQTDPTDFEPDDATVIAAISATAHQYNQPFHITNDELQSGLEMSKLVDVNAAAFADKLITVVNALLTTGNFTTNEAITAAFAAFGFSDLADGWGKLQKSPIKNAVLNGQYMARILNTPGMFQAAGTEGGNGWKQFGWDRIEANSNWTGAGANVNGILCNPQAVLIGTSLPKSAPVSSGVLQQSTVTVPGLAIQAQQNMWFTTSSRTIRASFDIMMAAAIGDESAGVLVKNG